MLLLLLALVHIDSSFDRSSSSQAPLKRIGVIGAGNFGTTMARVIAENLPSQPDFDPIVRLWVHGTAEGSESLVKTINTRHENPRYLPGFSLPESVVAMSDLIEVTSASDFLVLVVPHQFLEQTLKIMAGHVRPGAVALSLIKGVSFHGDQIELATDMIERILHIPCGGLVGANIAKDVAAHHFCESTLVAPIPGSAESADPWLRMFARPYFEIETLTDIAGQQLFGTLKNVISLAGGFVDGLGLGQSSKAAIIRQGLAEMYRLALWLFPDRGVRFDTVLANCGFGDTVASSYGGRNRLCAEAFVRTGKSFEELEKELLNGQDLAGTKSTAGLFELLKQRNALKDFPFFATVYLVMTRRVPPSQILHSVGDHLEL